MGNRYVEKFFSLRCAPDVLATVGQVAKIEKEITEAVGVLRHVQKVVLRDRLKSFQLVDLCSGNALVPVTAVHVFPNIVNALALDKLKRDREWYRAKRFLYMNRDIYKGLDGLLGNTTTIITACHACGDLAFEAIRMYERYECVQHIVLLPCCSGTIKSMPALLSEKLDKYEKWALTLYHAVAAISTKSNVMRDKYIVSPKNISVTGSK